jgi:hypothetical protein
VRRDGGKGVGEERLAQRVIRQGIEERAKKPAK